MRVCSGNRDWHYTHWTVYPDRFHPDDFKDLSCHPSIPHAVDKFELNSHILPNAKRAATQLEVIDQEDVEVIALEDV